MDRITSILDVVLVIVALCLPIDRDGDDQSPLTVGSRELLLDFLVGRTMDWTAEPVGGIQLNRNGWMQLNRKTGANRACWNQREWHGVWVLRVVAVVNHFPANKINDLSNDALATGAPVVRCGNACGNLAATLWQSCGNFAAIVGLLQNEKSSLRMSHSCSFLASKWAKNGHLLVKSRFRLYPALMVRGRLGALFDGATG